MRPGLNHHTDRTGSFNPEPTAKAERAEGSVSAGTVGTRIGPLAPDAFAVGSGLNDSVCRD